ncbi:MAG TPA: class I SAM-dependent methyltransferase [Leptolyngbyaceae cyanobacterium M33_DOE_097]|uniref:Class I SAM-dependent methyltransferase n=1 Tax=Oscillatoriales cyanobacterium SpSt-418 TaxID=2282169 RepID=A0A7C3KDW3_9CYAN|nr:class I SAM-dependent methyltransferase [Leptolyngbyaceae cyanobacterium M33_DOE_097]
MKDIVANRSKVKLSHKARLILLSLRENGPVWTTYLLIYYLSSSISEWAYSQMSLFRKKHNLPGLNSTTMNYEIWRNWDWRNGGEEWTQSTEWKESLIRNILLRYMKTDGRILEIGPGAGRWTETLQKIASYLIAVDISDRCVEICRNKFAGCSNVDFFVNNGSELPFIADNSIDCVWSFDVFVHINVAEVTQYIKEFQRIVRTGGCVAIHHAQKGDVAGGWRSNMTSELFVDIAESNGFKVVAQITRWRDGQQEFEVGKYNDVVSVLEKVS